MQTIHHVQQHTSDSLPAPAEEQRLPGMLEVNVAKGDELDEALEAAVSTITKTAASYRIGVMVTRVSPGRYIVRAHPEVPYGLVRQRYS